MEFVTNSSVFCFQFVIIYNTNYTLNLMINEKKKKKTKIDPSSLDSNKSKHCKHYKRFI